MFLAFVKFIILKPPFSSLTLTMPLMPPQTVQVICNHKTLFPCMPQVHPILPPSVGRPSQPRPPDSWRWVVTPTAQRWRLSCDSPQRRLCWATTSLCYCSSRADHCNPKLLCGFEDEFLSHSVTVYYKHFRQDAFLLLCEDKYLLCVDKYLHFTT